MSGSVASKAPELPVADLIWVGEKTAHARNDSPVSGLLSSKMTLSYPFFLAAPILFRQQLHSFFKIE